MCQNEYIKVDMVTIYLTALFTLHCMCCSVVENIPPVVLTDEEICLEVVERSDS